MKTIDSTPSSNQQELHYSPYTPRQQFMSYHLRWQRWATLICHRRFGKRVTCDTPIPLAEGGFKIMGDIEDGDIILDERGEPTTVIKAHAVEANTDAYKIVFDDGTYVIADAEHLWLTQTKLDRAHINTMKRRKKPNPQQRPGTVKTTREIAETLIYQGESNHTIQLTEPVNYPERELPIPPYILGLWLGDGFKDQFTICNMDAEPLAAWRAYADENGFECVVAPGHESKATVLSLRQGKAQFHPNSLLRTLGVKGDKHIPYAYLYGSIEQRLELLAGILDSDGSISKRSNHIELTFRLKHLIDATRQLLESLGVKVRAPKEKWVQLKDWDEPRQYWRIDFTCPFNPFRCEKHAARWRPMHATHNQANKRFIIACEKTDPAPMRCLTVDSPNHLYLVTEHYIPTHNTVGVLNDTIARAMINRPDHLRQQFGYIAPTQVQARAVVWEYLKQYTAPYKHCGGYKISEQHLTLTLPDPSNDATQGSTIMLLGAENAERMRGLFFDGVVVDEAQLVPKYVVDSIVRPALADRQGWMTICGTVNSPDDLLYTSYEEALKNPDTHFSQIIRASESGVLPQDELDDLRRTMTNEAYEAELECNVHAVKQGRIFLPYLNVKQQTAVPYDRAAGPVITAWDLGISDTTSIWFAQLFGITVRLIHFYEESGQGLDHFVEYMRKLPFASAFGGHLLPHDSRVRELGTGVSRIETLRNLGLRNLKVVPKLPKAAQIDAARLLLPKCWFDAAQCNKGIIALRNYSYQYDKKREVYSINPLHNAHSNASDSFQILAVGLKMARTLAEENGNFDNSTGVFDFGGNDDAPQAPWSPPAGF